MRFASWLLIGGGTILCLVAFAGWVALNLFACGLAPGGCGLARFRFRWEDTEALMVFVPPFVLGCILTAGGIALRAANRRQQERRHSSDKPRQPDPGRTSSLPAPHKLATTLIRLTSPRRKACRKRS